MGAYRVGAASVGVHAGVLLALTALLARGGRSRYREAEPPKRRALIGLIWINMSTARILLYLHAREKNLRPCPLIRAGLEL